MNKASKWIRIALSIPIYAASILSGIVTAKISLSAVFVFFTGLMTAYDFGVAIGTQAVGLVTALITGVLWMFGTYVRAQPKQVEVEAP
ncbi:hypothetical protein [Pseudomonas trivialis]|uniref:Uncharacterized protein n=1 Tax=Pseudomonas trivialis TaxID=200450 RepID=A0A0H5AZB8_9PSED|nr:hypothetical protein [Pseudomonas trivialis]AKS09907.1 hypothetical protein AA957_28595 [Pseudomonas trivialis]